MDVEKALPRKVRKRLLPDKEVIRPNQYTGFKRYWYMPPVSAEDVKTALKPNKVGLRSIADSLLSSLWPLSQGITGCIKGKGKATIFYVDNSWQ